MSAHYSVLMSVYEKEEASFLRSRMESIFHQTVGSDDFILVCDGPLGDELNRVISEYQQKYPEVLKVIRLGINQGLGCALNIGLKSCRYDLVARMDSDDISFPNRCELQLEAFEKDPSLDILSGTIEEFEDSPEQITGKRKLPLTNDEICQFSKKRNPFNHPATMFRKTAVEAAGGYSEDFHLFEDYYLWIRMLKNRSQARNLTETLLKMRTSRKQMLRRGGLSYAKDMLAFHKWMMNSGWSSITDYLTGAVPHALVCVLPNTVRALVYRTLR